MSLTEVEVVFFFSKANKDRGGTVDNFVWGFNQDFI